ncbi:MAG: hypothetical protein Q9186_001928 [Xanthomendoza sp. 1 TL-2023]
MKGFPYPSASPGALQLYCGVILVLTLLTVRTASLQYENDVRISAVVRPQGEQGRPNRTIQHTLITLPYRIPHTQTILDLRYGRYIDRHEIADLLSLVQNDIAATIPIFGAEAALRNGEYDYKTEDEMALSVYSPPEVPPEERLTWHLLVNVVDGLVDLLVLQGRYRQVNFRVLDGPSRRFVGFGHIVQGHG